MDAKARDLSGIFCGGDCELLGLAARAAGLDVENIADRGAHVWFGRNPKSLQLWNPLGNDGDALRLSATLKINIDFQECCAWSRGHLGLIREFWGGDFEACYRRAIVRVAAAMSGAAK